MRRRTVKKVRWSGDEAGKSGKDLTDCNESGSVVADRQVADDWIYLKITTQFFQIKTKTTKIKN